MNNTPNYNFKDNIMFCAVDAIDRELRRVEDKVDCAIRSLGRPSGKPVCGGWDKPPCGCSDELEQIWMALRERYSNEEIDRLILQYIREHDKASNAHPKILRELERLCLELDKKANRTPPTKFDLPLINGFSRGHAAELWKSEDGLVVITFDIGKQDGSLIPSGAHEVGMLPQEFRPAGYLPHVAGVSRGPNGYLPTYTFVATDGRLIVYMDKENEEIAAGLSFYVEQ